MFIFRKYIFDFQSTHASDTRVPRDFADKMERDAIFNSWKGICLFSIFRFIKIRDIKKIILKTIDDAHILIRKIPESCRGIIFTVAVRFLSNKRDFRTLILITTFEKYV